MEPSAQQLADVVKLFYETKSATTVIRVVKQKYPGLIKLNRSRIYRIVRKFENRGTVTDVREKNAGRPKSVCTKENIASVEKVITETPQRSVRQVMRDLNGEISKTSVHRMLKFDLKLTPYKISIMQHLKQSDIDSRLDFAHWVLEKSASFPGCIWFSDEAHFYLNNAVNKQNFRFWGTDKPNMYAEKPLHGEKVTVWAALSSSGIIGPFFFQDSEHNTVTVNSERYLRLLKTKFLPALTRKERNLNSVWFQQDGATPHTAGNVIEWLNTTFGDRYISYRTQYVWPPHSPDLNPLDFFLWGYLKDRVYSPTPENTDMLKSAIRREMQKISEETLRAVIANFRRRMTLVIEERGRHLEHML